MVALPDPGPGTFHVSSSSLVVPAGDVRRRQSNPAEDGIFHGPPLEGG